MTIDELAINAQRTEYAETSEAKRKYLDRHRRLLVESNGGSLPPRTWGGPNGDSLWPEAERAAQAKREA